uniref:Uncharacterized protein n=1 Tax=Zea mays TaxID=4577 RepID=B8A244_MAIZE|nr:unknown [Zea mays]
MAISSGFSGSDPSYCRSSSSVISPTCTGSGTGGGGAVWASSRRGGGWRGARRLDPTLYIATAAATPASTARGGAPFAADHSSASFAGTLTPPCPAPGATPHAAGRDPAAANTLKTYGRTRAPPARRRRDGERWCGADRGARSHSEHLLDAVGWKMSPSP